jgi:hypothetical protein
VDEPEGRSSLTGARGFTDVKVGVTAAGGSTHILFDGSIGGCHNG